MPHDSDAPIKHGIITSLLIDSVEVELAEEGIVNVPWLDICKDINVGDYVEITGGEYRGRTGWFEVIKGFLSILKVATVFKVHIGKLHCTV